jgi:hypothetical protein
MSASLCSALSDSFLVDFFWMLQTTSERFALRFFAIRRELSTGKYRARGLKKD